MFFGGSPDWTYYRITDKYLTGSKDDQIDIRYPKKFSDNFQLPAAPVTLDNIYQRTESDQKIYGFTVAGGQYGWISWADKYTTLPALCTPCLKDPLAVD